MTAPRMGPVPSAKKTFEGVQTAPQMQVSLCEPLVVPKTVVRHKRCNQRMLGWRKSTSWSKETAWTLITRGVTPSPTGGGQKASRKKRPFKTGKKISCGATTKYLMNENQKNKFKEVSSPLDDRRFCRETTRGPYQ